MKYIANCSFGKDSLAQIITIKKLGLPLDEVIYCDILFSDAPGALAGNTLSWQNGYPQQKKS